MIGMLSKQTHDAVDAELVRACNKHGVHRTPLNSRMSNRSKLVILIEEVGEVARAMTYDEFDASKLYSELIEVSAMSAAWAQSMKKEGV